MIGCYARVSTQEQAQNGSSIEEQTERMQKYCEAMNWDIFKVYTDAGFSGAKTDRPALQRLIRDVKSHKIDKVLVYKLDRLSRSQKDTLMLIEDVFLSNNCEFVSMNENFDTSSPFGRAMIGILAVFAQLEREQIRERMVMGKDNRAKKGLHSGSRYAPIGYDYIDNELFVNEFEKMQVVQVFTDYSKGLSPRKIAEKMNDAGLSHRYGKWIDATVRDILTKKTYIGYISYNGEWFKGHHEPLISEDLFDACQSIRDQRCIDYKRHNRRAGLANSYLGGFLVCSHCHAHYSKLGKRCPKGGKVYYYDYYVCNSRLKRDKKLITDGSCMNKRWRMEDLDSLVFDEIKKLSLEPSQIRQIQTDDDRPAIIDKKIKDLESQLERLMDLYTVGDVPIDILQERIYNLNDQKIKLETELDDILKEQQERISQDDALKLVRSFDDVLSRADFYEIRSIVEALIEYIEIDDDDVCIHWKFA